MRKLSEFEIAEAWRFRNGDKLHWPVIARAYDLSVEGLRRQIDPNYRERRNAYSKAWMAQTAARDRALQQTLAANRAQISAARGLR